MEKLLLVLISLFLGYHQGIKKERKRNGKSGGIIQSIKDKHSSKGKIIQEQERKIFELQVEIERLTSSQIENDKEKLPSELAPLMRHLERGKKARKGCDFLREN